MKYGENNYAFIDSNNLYLSIKAQGWKLGYKRFRRYLYDKFSVTKAFLFIGYVSTYKNMYKSLQKDGFVIKFKPTISLTDEELKGNVDAELVLHTMIQYDKFDKAIIVTGDGDFYCLVKYLIRKDKFLKLIVPDKYNYSSLYRKFNRSIVFMNGLKRKLRYVERRERH